MVWLRLVHIVGGIFWVGSALFSAIVLIPTVRAAGPDGRRFMERLARRLAPTVGVAMLLTIVPGFIMYGQVRRTWAASPMGRALGVGALATILAILVFLGVNAPAAAKMGRLRKALAAQRTPPASDTPELEALASRMDRGTQITAMLLLVAASAMAVARYL